MEARKDMAAWALRDTYRTLNTQSLTGQREKITQRYAEERGVRRGEERRSEEIRNRIAGRRLRA